VPQTPDRFPGEADEEGIILEDAGVDPTVLGGIRLNGDHFRALDATGVFNLRLIRSGTAFPSPPAAGELFWRTDEKKLYRRNNGDTDWDLEGLTADQYAALAGSYGTPSASNVFVTDTDPYYLIPGQIIRVSPDGRGQFSSVATAIASISDASVTKRYVVKLAPGEYTEPPFTIPAYVYVEGADPWGGSHLKTNDLTAHFITMSANSGLEDCDISGPTTAAKAAIDWSGSGVIKLRRLNIRVGYYGVWGHGASAGTTSRIHAWDLVGVSASSGAIHTLFRTTDYSHLQATACGPMTGSGWTYGFFADGANTTQALYSCFGRASGGTAVFADNLANVRANATVFSSGTTGVWAGSAGANIDISAGQFRPGGFTTEIKIDSASLGSFSFSGYAKRDTFSIASGASTYFNFLDDQSAKKGVYVWNELVVGNPGFETPMSGVLEAIRSTGLLSGGAITINTGRDVDVAAGSGFFYTVNGLIKVSWGAATITLPASENHIHIFVTSAGTVSSSTTPQDYNAVVILAAAATTATGIVVLAQESVTLPFLPSTLHEYFEDVLGPRLIAGCGAALSGTPPTLQFTIDAGTYFTADNEQSAAASATPCSFTTWYRDGSGGWTKTTAQTTLDDENYDDGSGTLAAIPATEYVRHKAYVTTSAGVSQWHVVYGQTTFPTAGDATSDPTPPDILLTHGLPSGAFVILKSDADVTTLVDVRPTFASGGGGGGGGVTDHGLLTGLADDDHTQYQLRSEEGAASGYCGLNASAKVANTNLDVATSPPPAVSVGAAAVGSGPKLAFEDHTHSLTVGSPIALVVGGANADGTATSAVRSDHKHSLPAFGTSAGTFAEGNDARLSDDRTASGLRSATTVVSVSAATAPTAGQVLRATAANLATWQTITGSGKILQLVEVDLAIDFSSNSTTFVTLLSSTITIQAGSSVLVVASWGGGLNGSAWSRVVVNGTNGAVVGSHGHGGATNALGAAPAHQCPAVPGGGVITCTLQVRTGGNTLTVRPATQPNSEGATILMFEVGP
jgi:hypothetical protein